ncbi:competence/damage-inducible protein A [bacterium]|nr:competence/damage-inducible protein A [bacterium]
MLKIEIISVGDELLIGETVNNNAAFMGRLLFETGVDVQWHTVVGDVEEKIVSAIKTAWNRADLILMTGGLGPTHDDITKDALCNFFNVEYKFHIDIVDEVRARFVTRGREMPEIVRNQGMIPAGASLIRNEIGSAFGIQFDRQGKTLIAMPGVPTEMRKMMKDSVIPFVRQITGSETIRMQRIKTAGIIESQLVTNFKQLDSVRKLVKVAVLPKATGVELRFTAFANDPKEAESLINRSVQMAQEDIGSFIVSIGDESIENTVARLLINDGLTISTAESCTGGLVAHLLTNVPGSSAYMVGSIVSYSNRIKTDFVGVSEQLIELYGAVSAQVAEAMASGIRQKMKTDWGLATTGIAGPAGGSSNKPVGLVYVAVSGPEGTTHEKHCFPKGRIQNKQRFATAALDLLRKKMQRIP